MEKEFIKLGWELLEHKYRYYVLNSPTIGDTDFDKMEARYRKLAAELGEEPTAVDMVDFDWKRPACKAAAFRVHGLNPYKKELLLHTDGSVYERRKGNSVKIRG